MLTGFVITLGIINVATFFAGLALGPMGIAIGYMVSMYVSVVLEFIIPTMIYFGEMAENYRIY